jgi:hypothetical protein
MAYERIKTEHAGAKNGGGAWTTRTEAKQTAKRQRRQVDKQTTRKMLNDEPMPDVAATVRRSREAVAQTPPIRAADDVIDVDGNGRGPRPPDQAAAAARECRWSFRRLCVAAIRRHSERAAARPLRLNRSIRRFALIWANTGSTIHCLCE